MNKVRVNSPFRTHESFTGSCFASEVERTAAFSFRDIFKKKETTESSSADTSATGTKEGSGIASILGTGIAGLFSVAGGIAPVLPQLGIGSKSRINETNATAAANLKLQTGQMQLIAAQSEAESKKSKDLQKIILISFVSILVLAMVVLTLRK